MSRRNLLDSNHRVSLGVMAFAGIGVASAAAFLVLSIALPRPAHRSPDPLPLLRPASTGVSSSLRASALQAPLAFEVNRGQAGKAGDQVKFLARSGNSIVYFTDTEAVLETAGVECATGAAVNCRAWRPTQDRDVLRMRFSGARSVTPEAASPLPTRVNYIQDGSSAIASVPTYAGVSYRQLYPGVDAVFYGRNDLLEYDLQLAPYADLAQVRLAFSGPSAARIDRTGDLDLTLGSRTITLRRPTAYQTVSGNRRAVDVHYVASSDGRFGLSAGEYDHNRTMVIDPVLQWASYIGGTSFNTINAVAVDSNGNGYLTGTTLSSDFPTTAGVIQAANAGSFDVFVTKVAASGASISYSTYIGGNGDDEAFGIAVDSTGAAYVTGYTLSANFPTTAGAFRTTIAPSTSGVAADAFVSKLNPTGTALVYSTFVGGNNDDKAAAIAVDSSGDAVIVGYTTSTNFPTTAGVPQTTLNGKNNLFITELNPAGAALNFSTYLGGSGNDFATGVALDASANVYVTGYTNSPNFPTSAAAAQSTIGGSNDAFITKLDRTGLSVDYSTFLGGAKDDESNAIAVDQSGTAFIAGFTDSINFPTSASAFRTSLASGNDAFVASLSRNGTSLVYSTYLGGSSSDIATGIAIDSVDDAYVAGYTQSSDFPVTSNAAQAQLNGNNDAFLVKLTPSGNNVLYGTFYGGTQNDEANGIALDAAGDIYIAGETFSSDFPVTAGVLGATATSNTDGFIVKFQTAPQGVFTPSTLGFPAQGVKVASAGEGVTLTNGGEKPLVVSSFATTGPFTQSNTCPASLVPGASCNVTVVFTPTAIGAAAGTLVVNDNGPGGKQTLQLSGSGGNFTFAVSPTTATIANGSSASFSVTVTPAAGYTQIVNLACTGTLPANSTCTPSPTSLTMNGTSASTATFTITTTARPANIPPAPVGPDPGSWLRIVSWLALLILLTMVAVRNLRPGWIRPRLAIWATVMVLGAWLGLSVACGAGSGNPGTPAGNYNIILTGTSSTTSTDTTSVTVTLTVN